MLNHEFPQRKKPCYSFLQLHGKINITRVYNTLISLRKWKINQIFELRNSEVKHLGVNFSLSYRQPVLFIRDVTMQPSVPSQIGSTFVQSVCPLFTNLCRHPAATDSVEAAFWVSLSMYKIIEPKIKKKKKSTVSEKKCIVLYTIRLSILFDHRF